MALFGPEGQLRGAVKLRLLCGSPGPHPYADEKHKACYGRSNAKKVDVHVAVLRWRFKLFQCKAEALEVSNHGVQLGLAFDLGGCVGNLGIGVRHTDGTQGPHVRLD